MLQTPVFSASNSYNIINNASENTQALQRIYIYMVDVCSQLVVELCSWCMTGVYGLWESGACSSWANGVCSLWMSGICS